jgi:hypothetical protein
MSGSRDAVRPGADRFFYPLATSPTVLFGLAALGLFQTAVSLPVPLVCGIALMIFPYFVDNPWFLVATGAVPSAVPYFVRL